MKQHLKEAVSTGLVEKVVDQKWHDRLLSSRWSDDQLSKRSCIAWLSKQLLPTRVYAAYETGISDRNNIMCMMCGKAPECIAHVLAGCLSLVQTKYLERHNAALKVLFFEILRDLDLNETVPPWFSSIEPKPMYESTHAQAFWDVRAHCCMCQQGRCAHC